MVNTVSVLALLVGAVAAITPVGDPTGNPITAPLNEIVPACKPFTIKWNATSHNTVSLILLRGPSTNVVPLATIVESIPNSGSYVWTPASSLEADTTHYGIQLVEDVTGHYQYSTQFGISKDACGAVSSVSSGYPTSSVYSTVVPSTSCNTTTVHTATSSHVAPTGYPVSNSSIVLPTKSMSVPVSLKTSASGSPVAPTSASASPTAPQSTGAASSLRAGLGLAGAIAGMVFML